MPIEALGASAASESPRIVVIRAFTDTKAVVAMLNAGYPVVVVLHPASQGERAVDFLSGWAVGSGGELDRIGQNTVLARPAHCAPIQLGKSGVVSAVEEVFAGDGPRALSRDEEERLIPEAVAGSANARRRLIDAYSELATLFALKVRPRSVSEARAVRVAQQELDRLVTFRSKGPLLASLLEGITRNLVQ